MRLFNCLIKSILQLLIFGGIILPVISLAQGENLQLPENSGVLHHQGGSSPYDYLSPDLDSQTVKQLALIASIVGSAGLIFINIASSPVISAKYFERKKVGTTQKLDLKDKYLGKGNA